MFGCIEGFWLPRIRKHKRRVESPRNQTTKQLMPAESKIERKHQRSFCVQGTLIAQKFVLWLTWIVEGRAGPPHEWRWSSEFLNSYFAFVSSKECYVLVDIKQYKRQWNIGVSKGRAKEHFDTMNELRGRGGYLEPCSFKCWGIVQKDQKRVDAFKGGGGRTWDLRTDQLTVNSGKTLDK